MNEYQFNFVGYPNYKISGLAECWAYDDKGKKKIKDFSVGDKFWIINEITKKRVAELTIQSIEVI